LHYIKETHKTVVGHNIKFDLKFLYHNTGELLFDVYDTQIAETLLHAGLQKGFYPSLSNLCKEYTGVNMDKEAREIFISNPDIVLTEKELIYSAMDVNYLFKIMESQMNKIRKEDLVNVLDLEMKLLPLLAQVEYEGVSFLKTTWMDLYKKNLEMLKNAEIDAIKYLLDNIDLSKYSNAYEFAKDLNIRVSTKKLQAELETLQTEYILEWAKNNINIKSNKQVLRHLNLLGFEVDSTGVLVLKTFKRRRQLRR